MIDLSPTRTTGGCSLAVSFNRELTRLGGIELLLEVTIVEAATAELEVKFEAAVVTEVVRLLLGVVVEPAVDEGVDLIITVRGWVLVNVGQLEVVWPVVGATAEVTDEVTVLLLEAFCCFTGDTRTRRTLPSADTLTNLTGTILDPGGTKCAGRTCNKINEICIYSN